MRLTSRNYAELSWRGYDTPGGSRLSLAHDAVGTWFLKRLLNHRRTTQRPCQRRSISFCVASPHADRTTSSHGTRAGCCGRVAARYPHG